MLSTAARASSTSQYAKVASTFVGVTAAGAATFYATPATVECSWWNPLSWFYGTDYSKLRTDIEEVVEDNMAGPLMVRLAWQ